MSKDLYWTNTVIEDECEFGLLVERLALGPGSSSGPPSWIVSLQGVVAPKPVIERMFTLGRKTWRLYPTRAATKYATIVCDVLMWGPVVGTLSCNSFYCCYQATLLVKEYTPIEEDVAELSAGEARLQAELKLLRDRVTNLEKKSK